ncbi:hypothetical protein [Serratia fonticola]|uniref:hypothetical protein n=1 Tax=Serratia fonticola TaxID=47917 RepID=UPI0021BD44F4|nr:hypothetical protein [Serratia fonticola]
MGLNKSFSGITEGSAAGAGDQQKPTGGNERRAELGILTAGLKIVTEAVAIQLSPMTKVTPKQRIKIVMMTARISRLNARI